MAAIMIAVGLMTATPAWAAPAYDNRVGNPNYNHWCYNSSQAYSNYVCRTDNASLGWWMENTLDTTTSRNDTGAETAINDTMDISYTNTDLNPYYDSTPKWSGSGEIDIVYRSIASEFTTNDDGYTWCDDAVTGGTYECDQQYVNFRYKSTARPLACHETGHAVGLVHGPSATPSLNEDDTRLQCMMKHTIWDRRGLGDNAANINLMY